MTILMPITIYLFSESPEYQALGPFLLTPIVIRLHNTRMIMTPIPVRLEFASSDPNLTSSNNTTWLFLPAILGATITQNAVVLITPGGMDTHCAPLRHCPHSCRRSRCCGRC